MYYIMNETIIIQNTLHNNYLCLHFEGQYEHIYLSVNGVITRRGVFPRYSWEYLNCASQIFAKQSFSLSSHLCRNCDSQAKAWELSTLVVIILVTTSLACTSMVQIVMIFCLSPLDKLPISMVMRLFSCWIYKFSMTYIKLHQQ